MNISIQHMPSLFGLAFIAIMFLQSGIDKLSNYKKELGWIRQKFSRSFLHGYVGTLFTILTFCEITSGFLAAGGFFQVLFTFNSNVAMLGACSATVTMLMLFFGQRITKDYSGAASLVPYFIACILTVFFLSYRIVSGCTM